MITKIKHHLWYIYIYLKVTLSTYSQKSPFKNDEFQEVVC